jgi:hypothetical protein
MITDSLPGPTATRSAAHRLSPTRWTYYGLRRAGLSREEAGNLTARLAGIGPVRGGWSVTEIERLRFLRWLADAERCGG